MGMTRPSQCCFSSQITHWWQEAEQAFRSGQVARAQRFLRWIVACCPEEEEAWLVLARSIPESQDQILILRSAYRFHPESQRIQAALREARQHQLASAVGELKPRRAIARCLPDERQLSEQAGSASSNGRRPNHRAERGLPPPAETETAGFRPFPPLTKLLQWWSTPSRDDGGNGRRAELPPEQDPSRP